MGNNRGVKQAVFLSVSAVVFACSAAMAVDRYDRTIGAVPDRDVKDDGALVEGNEIDLMCSIEGGGARVDDPCPLINSLEVSCDLERSRLWATVFSDLPPCTRLRLVADDAFYRDTRVFWHGRAWAMWRFPMPGEHEVCIDGCDICATVSCGCATDEDCDDGLYCNGQETCNIETGECLQGEYPCAEGEICDEENDVCISELTEKIVFTARMSPGDELDVFTMDPDGTDLINLTDDFDADTARLAVSPDGTRIAFSAAEPLRGIWVMNADGSDKTEIVAGLVDTPRWFDNDTVFYALTLTADCPFPVEIRKIDFVDGATPTWTNDELVVSNPASIGQNTTETFDISPDRTMLVWNAQIGCWSPTSDIYICDLNGTVCTNSRPFYADAGDNQMDVLPIWSHDGQTVYWAHDITPGVETATAIVKKAIDSSVPVTEYDEVVRPAGACGLELSGLFAVAPDDSKLLLFLPAGHGLYTWDLVLPGDCDTLLLSADYVRDAYWGLLASDL